MTQPEVFSRAHDVVAWDLDSTVFDTSHRQYLIDEVKARRATWDDYSMLCVNDTPVPGSAELMRLLAQTTRQVAISGRSQCALDLTWQVARKFSIPLDDIRLRPDGDNTENGLFKVGELNRLELEGFRVRLFIEDWPPSAEFIRKMTRVPVLVVNPCYPEKTAGSV